MKSLFWSWFVLPALSLPAIAQDSVHPLAPSSPLSAPTSAAPSLRPEYAAESAVIEQMDSVYKMEADGTGTRLETMAIRLQSDAALRQFGVLTIPYAANSEHVEIVYARVRHVDGSRSETPASQAIEIASPVTRDAPLYSDLKQQQLPIRSLKVGDTLEWQVKIVRTKAEAPGQFWGQASFLDGAVVLSQSVELRYPENLYVNVWSPGHAPTESVRGGEHIFRWIYAQPKPTVGKEADAAKEAKSKRVWTAQEELDAKEGKLPDIAWTTFKNWAAVGAWYQGLERDRITPNPEIKAKVAELTAGKATQEEKVRAVYAYVSAQIRYIGVDFGVGRFQPHHASEVLENQYGDCKDKHTLLAAMLSVLGLHADAALIGVGIRFNEAVPSPAAFNHVITTLVVEARPVWLDATTEIAPYRVLTSMIRNKAVLAIPDLGIAQMTRTPAELPFPSLTTMNAVGTLDNKGVSNSRLTLTLRGDAELLVRAVLRGATPAQYDPIVQQMSGGMGFGGVTSHAEASRPDDTTEPLSMSYDYKREQAGDWEHLRIIPQLLPVSLPLLDEKQPPVQAITLDVPRVERSTAAMTLPNGWGVVLPEALHAKSQYATLDQTYRFTKGVLYAEREVRVLQEKIPVSEWKAYKKWTDAASLGSEQYVQLVRNNRAPSPDKASTASAETSKSEKGNPSSIAGTNDAAAKLIEASREAMTRHDLDAVKTMLDQARQINNQQAYLWTSYAYLDFQRGEISTGIVDFEKELSFHRDEYGVYPLLAKAQTMLGKHKEVRETLRTWAKEDDTNPMASASLVGLLLQEGSAVEAIDAAEAAILRLPEKKKKNENLQLLLGRAQILAGTKEKGGATIAAVLRTTDDAGMMNNCAYFLADSGQELSLAESSTRTALQKMDERSKTWTLDEDLQTLSGQTQVLAATWDTMGWILFHQGKTEEAESYIQASWLNRQSAEVGEHLAVLATTRGNKDAALGDYELALQTIPHFEMMGVRTPPTATDKRLQATAAALRQAGAKSSVHDAAKSLQNLRFLPLGQANGLNGTAEYRLLLSNGKVERAEVIGTKELQGGETKVKTANLASFWPAGSHASMVRTGILNCHSATCELVLEP